MVNDIPEIRIEDLAWGEVAADSKVRGMLGSTNVYAWADVDVDGSYELINIMDFSGRGFFRNLHIVKRVADKFRGQWAFISNSYEINTSLDRLQSPPRGVSLVDMDGDGTPG
jgi:hypothetical protein